MNSSRIIILTGLIFLSLIFSPTLALGRVTPNDIYQANRADFEANLNKISDPTQKQAVIDSDNELKNINKTVTSRFDVDIAKMAAILEEIKNRQNITKNVVAYGMGDTPIDTAEYYLNYAEEANAYQKVQDYTPDISSGNLKSGVTSSMDNLNSNLQIVQGKILTAKTYVGKALDFYQK